MSRLLQALKNLEARTPKAPAKSVLAHLADNVRSDSPAPPVASVLAHLADKFHSPSPDPPAERTVKSEVSRPTPLAPQPLDGPLAYLSASVPAILLDNRQPVASYEPEPAAAPVFERPPPPPPPGAPAPAQQPPPVYAPPAAVVESAVFASPAPTPTQGSPRLTGSFRLTGPPPPATASREPTLLERAVRRTLSEPQRSEPLRQLAQRLKNDLDQVAGRSILITGIGPASETHEVTLQAAAILAEGNDEILVIDGDAAHRTLSAQLECASTFGLTELAENQEPTVDPIQPTTFEHLSLLPVGKARMPDPTAAGNRLASLIQSLEQSYRLVLINGGRAGAPSSAALARLCDATYFVVRLGETEASHAQAALRNFRANGARILGCIATS